MAKIKIIKKDIQAYENVRSSGVTNMFDIKKVELFSGLSRDKILIIMRDYGYLIKKYKIKRG